MPETTDTIRQAQAERKARLDARWAEATTPEGLATCDTCGSPEAHTSCDEPAPTAAERRQHARLHDSDGAFIGCAWCMERVAGHGPDLDMCRPCYRQARRDGTVDVEERR